MSAGLAAVWHDVECGAYEADLPLWRELADAEAAPILDLGCGTGRVALDLGARGHRVVGLDSDAELTAALRERAGELPVEAVVADARGFDLGSTFGLVLAPMQLLQLLSGREERLACLGSVHRHLRPGGLAAFAIVEDVPADADGPPPSPDAAERGGWTFSSLPVAVDLGREEIRIRRLRQALSPSGDLSEEADEVSLARLDPAALEAEAGLGGLVPCGRRRIGATRAHVGSTVVLARRER
jgi:SAM-dependent methyltransferase